MTLNILNIILVLILAYKLFRSRLSAFFAALIFTLHPTHGEVVVLLWSKFDVLVGIFYLLSMILFLTSLEIREKEEGRGSNGRRLHGGLFLFCSVFSFILALASKEMAMTLPFAILLYVVMNNLEMGFAKSFLIALKRSFYHFMVLIFFVIFLGARASSSKYVSTIIDQFPEFGKNIADHLEILIVPSFFLFLLLLGLFAGDRRYNFAILFMLLSLVPLIHMVTEQRFMFIPTIGYSLALAWLLTDGIKFILSLIAKLKFLKIKDNHLNVGRYCIIGLAIISLISFLWVESRKNLQYWHRVQYERNYVPLIIEACPTLPEGIILFLCDSGYEDDAPPDESMLSLSGELVFHYGEKIRALSLIRYFYPKTSPVFKDLDSSLVLEFRNDKFIRRDDLLEKAKAISDNAGMLTYGLADETIGGDKAIKDTYGKGSIYVFDDLKYPGYRFGRIEVELKSPRIENTYPTVKFGFYNERRYEYKMLGDDKENRFFHIDLYTNLNWILKENVGRIYIRVEDGGNLGLKRVILKTPPPIFFDMLKVGFPWLRR